MVNSGEKMWLGDCISCAYVIIILRWWRHPRTSRAGLSSALERTEKLNGV